MYSRMRFRSSLAIAALLAAAAAPADGQRLPSGVDEREVNLYARLLAMTDTRTLDTALVERALSSKWKPLRAAATLAIDRWPDVRRPELCDFARCSGPDVTRGDAAYALVSCRPRFDPT